MSEMSVPYMIDYPAAYERVCQQLAEANASIKQFDELTDRQSIHISDLAHEVDKANAKIAELEKEMGEMSECYADMAGGDCNCQMCKYLETPEAKDAIRVGRIVAEQHKKIKALELRVHQFDQAIRRIGRHVGACCGGVDVMDDNGLGSHTDQEIIRKIDAKIVELQADNEALNKTLRNKGWGQGEIDSVTDLWERIEELQAKLEVSEPVAWRVWPKYSERVTPAITDLETNVAEARKLGLKVEPLFTAPPQVEAAVEGFRRRAIDSINRLNILGASQHHIESYNIALQTVKNSIESLPAFDKGE